MNDPFRFDGGQYRHSPECAGQGEQFLAGVNQFDSPANASWKVQGQRTAMGLDPHTGALPWRSWHVLPAKDEGQIANVMGPVLKLFILWPTILGVVCVMILAALACLDAAWRGRDPAAGFARFVAARVARDVNLAVPAVYLQPKQIEAAGRGNALLSPLAKPSPKDLTAAYLCQVVPSCAAEAEARVGPATLWRAEHFLLAKAKVGNERAALDMCLLPLMTLRSEPVLAARDACAAAAKESGSVEVRALSERLQSSWLAHGARAVEVVARMFSVDRPTGADQGRASAKP